MPDVLSQPGSGPLNLNARPPQAFGKRLAAAADDLQVPSPGGHPNNGDEAKYPSGIANFTKGFPHNSFGEITPSVYASYLAAVKTGKRADFDALTLGGTEPLVDPQAGLAYDLETYDPSQNSIPPFNTLTSPGLRCADDRAVLAGADARRLIFRLRHGPDGRRRMLGVGRPLVFLGPRIGGSVTPQCLFRGFTAGDVIGPYVSQFFLQPFQIGVIPFQGYMTTLPGDFVTNLGCG